MNTPLDPTELATDVLTAINRYAFENTLATIEAQPGAPGDMTSYVIAGSFPWPYPTTCQSAYGVRLMYDTVGHPLDEAA